MAYFGPNPQTIQSGSLDSLRNLSDLSNTALARTNLSVPSQAEFDKALTTDPEAFTPAQQGQARANIGAGVLAGFRNKIINGDFEIWQRGTLITVPAISTKYVADRWVIQNETNAAVIVSRYNITSSDGAAIGARPRFGMQLYYASPATTGNLYVSQRIEGVNTLEGGKASPRYHIASSIAGLAARFNATQVFGAGGSSAFSFSGAPAITPGGSYSAMKDVLDIPSIAGKTVGSGNYLEFNLLLTPRAVGSIYLAHCSLVEGDTTAEADPFSPRHIQQEVALCQRYYWKTYDLDVPPGTPGYPSGGMFSTSNGGSYSSHSWSLPVLMRTAPSGAVYSPDSGASGMLTADGVETPATINTSPGMVRVVVSNIAQSNSTFNRAHIALDAEL